MIANLAPYAAYKDSGVEWLRKVPIHWTVQRLGRVLGERGEQNRDGQISEVLSVLRNRGVIPYSQKGNIGNKKSEDTTRYKIVRPFDIVVNSMNVIIGSVGLSRYTGCISPVYYVLTRRSTADNPRYLGSYFQTKPFQRSLTRIGNGILAHRMRIPMELLKCEPFPRPPRAEQDAIVRFLDHADRRIRRYLRAKERLIELLEEQKQVIIHQAVTGQIDVRTDQPYPAYKDSGVDWLGRVPAHWKVVRNGQLFVQRNEKGFPELPILEVSLKTGVRIRDLENPDRKQMMSVRGEYKRAVKLDIAYNMMRMWQGAVGVAPIDGLVSPAYVVAKPRRGSEPNYFSALFRTSAYMIEVDKYSRGIVKDRNRLYWEDFRRILTPYPPLDEQIQITNAIDQSMATIDAQLQRIHRQIELLREYRTRLIADVVTGKLDVRDAATHLPAVDPIAVGNRVDIIQAESNTRAMECGISNEANP